MVNTAKKSVWISFCLICVLLVFCSGAYAQDDPLDVSAGGKARLLRRPEILINARKNFNAFDAQGQCIYAGYWPVFEHGDALAVGNVDEDSAEELIWASHENDYVYVEDMKDMWDGRPHIQTYLAVPGLAEYPLLVVADINGDGEDEIILGPDEGERIRVYDGDGSDEGLLYLGYWDRGDRLAAGDIDGDGRVELIYADRSEDKLFIYETDSGETTNLEMPDDFDFYFHSMDGLATGDLDLDGIDEIVVASSGLDQFLIITGEGQVNDFHGPIGGWDGKIADYDGLAVGDVDHDGFEEIVFADRDENRIFIFEVDGTSLGRGKGIEILDIMESYNFSYWFDQGDVVVVGDIDNDSVLVGEPRRLEATVTDRTVAVIYTPPKHRGLNCGPQMYCAEFRSESGQESSMTIKSVSSSVFTEKLWGGVGALGVSIQGKLTRKGERKLTREHTIAWRTEEGRTTPACLCDRVIVVSTDFEVWEYPIIAPEELAVIDGEPQFIAVTMPISSPTSRAPYLDRDKCPRCQYEDIFSYPRSRQELEGYEPSNLIWAAGIEVGPESGDEVWFTQEETETGKTIRDSYIETGWSTGGGGGIDLGFLQIGGGAEFSGTYGEQTVTTHEISFANKQGVHVYWTGPPADELDQWGPGDFYTVDHVLYHRTDGVLVLDHVVVDIGWSLYNYRRWGFEPGPGVTQATDIRPWVPIDPGITTLEDYVIALELPAIVAGDSRMWTGRNVAVPLRIVNASNLGRVDLEVGYDPGVLLATNVEKGSLITGGGGIIEPALQYQFEDGLVQITAQKSGGISGSGELALIEFDVIGGDECGCSELDVEGSAIEFGTGETVALAFRSGIFVVDITGDFNLDRYVDLLDYAVFAPAWRSKSGDNNWDALCDMSEPSDNVIDKRDLAVLAAKWLAGY